MSKLIITMSLLDKDGYVLGSVSTDDNSKCVPCPITMTGEVDILKTEFQDLVVKKSFVAKVKKGDTMHLCPSDEHGVFIGFGDLII